MTAWILVAALYVVGFVGLEQMGRDISSKPRSVRTWIALVFWPVTVSFAKLADGVDAFLASKS